MSNILTPNYMDIDYNTVKERLKDLLSKTNDFKDYNYEGSNISLLIELVSYLSALTTYYGNKIAQNQYIETADMYETVHMLSRLSGYEPKGYVSANGYVNVTLLNDNIDGTIFINPGDTLYIPAWSQLKSSTQTDSNGDPIYYSNILPFSERLPDIITYPYRLDMSLYVVQGRVSKYNNVYKGSDLIDNKLYLPLEKFDHNNIELTVNNSEPWLRIYNHYDNIDDLTKEDNVYQFKFDKYKKYYIEFSNLRNIPEKTDVINITALISSGLDGNSGSGNIDTIVSDDFVYNLTTSNWIAKKIVDVKNNLSTSGGVNPEDINSIKKSSTVSSHTQYRTVTKKDYIKILEQRDDIIKANVWGEQNVSTFGNYFEYNKIYISMLPNMFGNDTLKLDDDIYPQPISYSNDWLNDIKMYLGEYKHISTYEMFEMFQFIYFAFTIGLKIKRTYQFNSVSSAVKRKLMHYFDKKNRNFGDRINFHDIKKYLTDPNNNNIDFLDTVGIESITIRGITMLPINFIFEPNDEGNYPQYESDEYLNYDNKITNIILSDSQFPVLDISSTVIIEEM